jgi:hypothetical protein
MENNQQPYKYLLRTVARKSSVYPAYPENRYPPATLGYGVPVMTNIYRSEGLQVRQWKRTPRGFSFNFTVLQEKLYSPFYRTKVSVYEDSQQFFIKISRDKKE